MVRRPKTRRLETDVRPPYEGREDHWGLVEPDYVWSLEKTKSIVRFDMEEVTPDLGSRPLPRGNVETRRNYENKSGSQGISKGNDRKKDI